MLILKIDIWTYIAEDLHLWWICDYIWPYIDILVYGVDFMVPIDPKCDSTMSRYPVFCSTPSELGERSILIFFAGSSAQIWKIVDLKNFRSGKCWKSKMPKSHQNRFWRLLRFSIFKYYCKIFSSIIFWKSTFLAFFRPKQPCMVKISIRNQNESFSKFNLEIKKNLKKSIFDLSGAPGPLSD